ncbi:MAG: DUF4097 family beta strand repeat-containing protein [Pyrinomonadaceae bacterium]
MIKRFIISLTLSLALLPTCAPLALAQRDTRDLLRDEMHQSYKLSSDGRIMLNNINGNVRIQGWERDEVRLDAVKSAYTRKRLDEANIEVRAGTDSVEIRTRYPDESQTFTDEAPRKYDNPATVEYTLNVPRNARLESIELINGSLDLTGLAGEVHASSINGKLSAQGLSGEAKLSTINGPLEATFTRLDANKSVSLNSVNGTVLLVIPSDANASVKADTVHGAITNDFGLPVRRGRYVGTDLAGQIGQGGPRIKLGNVNGIINVRHASDGRTLSPVQNLLTGTDDDGYAPSGEAIQRQIEREVERAQREAERAREEGERAAEQAQREVEQAQREAERGRTQAQREAEQAQREAQREAAQARRDAQRAQGQSQREAEQARQEALREQEQAQREREQAQREAQQEQQEAQREAERERAEAQREAERERVEAQREAERERAEALREQDQARREVEQAQREAERERREAQREAERERLEAQREAERARAEVDHQVSGDYYGNYRLVERETKSLPVQGTPRVRIETFDGAVSVEAWDRNEVQYTAIKRARNEQAMRAIRLNVEQRGAEINIIAAFDKSQQRGWQDTGATVALEVRVPRNTNLNVHTGDGRVRLTGVQGEVSLRTGDGAVDVTEGRGRLHIETGDGRVRVAQFDGEADAQSGDGHITLEGRFTRLAVRTSDGGISLTMPTDVDATIETDAGLVVNEGLATAADNSNDEQRVRRWRVGRGGNLFSLRTNDGSIYLRRADNTATR